MAGSAARANKTKAAVVVAREKRLEDPFSRIKGYKTEVGRLKSIAKAVSDISSGVTKAGSLPAGILLSGQPGMGKTSLAKAFAESTGLPIIGTDCVLNAETIHALYEAAKEEAPCVVLIDDVDKIVPEEDFDGYVSDESRAALKELISQLDGLSKAEGVITVMTANEYYSLNDALKRPGRVDVHIPIGAPSDDDRFSILEYYLGQYDGTFPCDDPFIETISKKAHGLSCAALKTLVNDVWLQTYDHAASMKTNDWADCFQRHILEIAGKGILKQSIKLEEDLRRICYHEAGHALVDYYLTGNLLDICVMQIEDSMAGGWTAPRAGDCTKKLYLYEDCINKMAAIYGGMAAERVIYGTHSMGVQDDLRVIMSYLSEMTACLIDTPVGDTPCFWTVPAILPDERCIDGEIQTDRYRQELHGLQYTYMLQAYSLAEKTLESHREELDMLATYLFDHGIASGETMAELLETGKTGE